MPTREHIYEMYTAYAEGRFDLLLREMVDDDITFVSYAPLEIFPTSDVATGKQHCLMPGKRPGPTSNF
jgi:hypothetical protein